MKLLVAIPALNEEFSISAVIRQVHQDLPNAKVLVVDDGSTDQTARLAKIAGAKVISLPFNVGVGGALRVAFKFAKENSYTHLIQIDADGQHLPSEAKKLLEAATQDSVVIGSRFLDPKNVYEVAIPRKIAMRVLSGVTNLICKTKLTDVTSGFRLASGEAISVFAAEYPRDYLGDTVESLIIAHRNGITISEVAVTMKHREFGNPSQNFAKSIWHLFRALIVILLSIFKKQ